MVPFRILFIRVPCNVGDLNRDPNLENYRNASVVSFREVGLIEVPIYWEWAFGLRGDWECLVKKAFSI